MKSLISIIISLYLLCMCLCTGNLAGTETTNGDEVTVTAGIDRIEGNAPEGFEITLFADDYYPVNDTGFLRSITVMESGTFQFSNLGFGDYNIYCKSPVSDTAIFIQHIMVEAIDHADTDTVALVMTGTVGGKLIDTLSRPIEGAYAYITGSPFYTLTNDSGEYVFAKIPQGSYTLEFALNNRNSAWTKGPAVSVDVSAGNATETDPVIYK